MILTAAQHKAGRAIACETCGAPAGTACFNITSQYSHALRAHTVIAMQRPLPTAADCAALTQVDGRRADAQPFLAWLSGAHEFRSNPFGNDMVLGVYKAGEVEMVATVRRALLELATGAGLLISAVESRGRGRHIVSPRGIALHAAGGDLEKFLASWQPELAATA